MMEVCTITSEWNRDQQTDEDKKVSLIITNETVAAMRDVDNRNVLWKRATNFDLTEGGSIAEGVKTDDLTIDGKGEIWPAHELFLSIDTDTGAELMQGRVVGHGYLVEMNPMEALVWLRELDKGSQAVA